jgi:hypothetical protein
MKDSAIELNSEPIGIVISSGKAAPKAPRFSAYVWAAETESEKETVKAA